MANTTNFNFELIDFDTIPWHTKDHDNWRLADAVFAQYISISGIKGVWTNSLAIAVNDKYVDSELGTIWTAELAHTSASSGTFATDRATNSSYWSTFSITQAFKGTWTINTAYSVNEFVVSGNKYAVCQTAHTSGATFDGDSAYWITLIDGTTIIDSCSAQATLAESYATTSSNWATKTDAVVSGSDYSSKEYAQGTQASTGGSSKSWAQDTDQVNGASTNDRSAKNWSQGSSMTGSTLGGSAKDWAQLAEDSQVNGSEYSSKHYSAKATASASAAASSATAAAAGQLYSTIVNQTASTLSPAMSADGTYYLCDTSSNSITITLPEIGANEGKKFSFQKTHASNNLIFQRSGSDTLNGSSSNITLTDVDSQIIFVCDNNSPDNWVGTNLNQIQAGTGLTKVGSVMSVTAGGIGLTQIAIAAKTECIAIACSDETTALEAGTAKATFHMPYAFTLTGVKASLTTAPVGSVLTVDINEAGSTILTTKLTIDASEKTSASAATPAVIGGAGPALAADALMTVDLDGVGSSTAGAGLKIYHIGYQT